MPKLSPRVTFLIRDLPMMSVGGGSASLCSQRQARARGTMAMSSPHVDDKDPVRIEDAWEAYERGGSVDVEPPGKPEARLADRAAPGTR